MRSRGSSRTVAQRLRVAAGALVLVLSLAGCTAVRNSLGTPDSSCYLALPTATRSVHGHGRLVGVHLFTLKTLRQRAPHLYRDLSHQPLSDSVCVSAFSGHFTRTSVSKPEGQDTTGTLAVVVTTLPGNKLLGTVIEAHAPLHFGHAHVG